VEDDGQVFIPAGVFMSERVAVLTLGYDGTPAYVEEDHVYVPADWLAREFPADAATIGEIVTNVRRSAGH
jgi:hypothetical protein